MIFSRSSISDWQRTALATLVFAALAAIFGQLTGLLTFTVTDDFGGLARIAAIAFVLPALVEETVFRGPLIWLANKGGANMLIATGLSLTLFVIWHLVNASLFLPAARETFFDWRFLTLATALGLVATWLALRARSLWPPIIFHWLIVVGWKAFLGGPEFLTTA